MKEHELQMLRQFVDTVFDLTHSLNYDDSPSKKEELLRVIGNGAFAAKTVSRLYQERGGSNA